MKQAMTYPETVYRLTYAGAWMDVLGVIHRQPAAVARVPLLGGAVETLLAAFFTALEGGAAPGGAALEKLLLLHSGRFVHLTADRLEAVVERLVAMHEQQPERALGYARFCPENARCAAVIRQFGVPTPVPHTREATLRLEAAGTATGTNATVSLFKSRQEVDFLWPPARSSRRTSSTPTSP